MIVVTGATGNVGKKIVEELLSRGQPVRALARSAERLKPLADRGAQFVSASLTDVAALTEAFRGADSVFVMIPPNYSAANFRTYQNEVSEAIATALTAARVSFVVDLSSLGAHRSEKMGPINGLYDHEQRLNKLTGVNILHLRPAFFMENLFANIPLIKNMGVAGSALRPNVSIPMIATRDIAHEAAERLMRRDFKGVTVKELLGPRDVSMIEAVRSLGRAIGRPDLPYVAFSYEDAEKAMVGMGFSSDAASLMVEMIQAFNEGLSKPTQPRSDETNTPTTVDQFASVFASAFKSN